MSTNAGIPVTPAQLTKWSIHADQANEAVQIARMLLVTGQEVEEGRNVRSLLFDAQQLTSQLYRATSRLAPLEKRLSPVPIELNQLDTPDTRELLSLLEQAQAVAERVDAARGYALPEHIPLQPGESRGTDLAETISEIALRVRIEVRGPKNGRE